MDPAVTGKPSDVERAVDDEVRVLDAVKPGMVDHHFRGGDDLSKDLRHLVGRGPDRESVMRSSPRSVALENVTPLASGHGGRPGGAPL